MEVNTNRMIPFNDTNYQAWKSKMKDFLYVKEYWKQVFSTEMPDDMKQDQWEILKELCPRGNNKLSYYYNSCS
jgi:hypothetical protein